MTATQKAVEAFRLLHDAAKMEDRGDDNPIHVKVTKNGITVILHAKDGTTQENKFTLPEGSP